MNDVVHTPTPRSVADRHSRVAFAALLMVFALTTLAPENTIAQAP